MPIPLPWAGLTLPVTCPDSSDDRSGISESPSIAEAPPSAGTRTVTRSVDQHRVHRRESNTDNTTFGSAKRAIMGGFRAARELPFSLTGLPNGPASAQMPGLPVL